MKSERLAIVDGVRTPFCKMGTDLAPAGADDWLLRLAGRFESNALEESR